MDEYVLRNGRRTFLGTRYLLCKSPSNQRYYLIDRATHTEVRDDHGARFEFLDEADAGAWADVHQRDPVRR